MKAGRELDALVAEKVMGWEPGLGGIHLFPPKDEPNRKRFTRWNGEAHVTEIPHYSTDIAAAWDVVEKLQRNGWGLILDNMQDYLGNWQAHFEKDMHVWTREADTAPIAICLAALKAVGVETGTP